MSPDRCPWAIRYGTSLTTRCHLGVDHDGPHEGRGLAQFPYQRVSWFKGDRREFETDRADEASWEES